MKLKKIKKYGVEDMISLWIVFSGAKGKHKPDHVQGKLEQHSSEYLEEKKWVNGKEKKHSKNHLDESIVLF